MQPGVPGTAGIMKKIATIGHGNVGSALDRGLTRAGYDIRATGRENIRD